MVKVKNKMYQPVPLLIDGKTVIVPSRGSIDVVNVTPQMVALKARGLLQIIRK
jgi:hypothetical protein